MNMVTTRGCPYTATGAPNRSGARPTTCAIPADVAAELALARGALRPDHIWFADDILGLKRGWMARFADELAAPRRPGALQVPEPRRPAAA